MYGERIRRYADLRLIVVPEERVPSKGKREYILHQEGRRIREKLSPDAFTVVLDERGKLLSSEAFARFLEKGSTRDPKKWPSFWAALMGWRRL